MDGLETVTDVRERSRSDRRERIDKIPLRESGIKRGLDNRRDVGIGHGPSLPSAPALFQPFFRKGPRLLLGRYANCRGWLAGCASAWRGFVASIDVSLEIDGDRVPLARIRAARNAGIDLPVFSKR